MHVLDASAAVDLLRGTPRGQRVADRLSADRDVVAPELVYVEASSALLKLVRTGTLPDAEAGQLIRAFTRLPLRAISHAALVDAAWGLRDRLRIADAFYVACAVLLRVPLLTTDARLGRASLPGVTVTTIQ